MSLEKRHAPIIALKFLWFEASLRQLRSNVNENVTSVACIPLSFSVQAQITGVHNISWNFDCSSMRYVDLMGVVK